MSSTIPDLMQKGLQHHQSGRLQEAEAIYQTVLRQQPQNPDALHLLGVLALQVGKPDVSAELIEKAIAEKPGEPQFYNMCGEAYRALRQYDTAIARFQQALAIAPDFAGAQNNLGNAYKESGRLEQAIECYRQAVLSAPDFVMSHNNLGIVYKDMGRAEDAIVHFEKALAIMPAYAEAQTNLGNVLLSLGRAEDAVVQHEQAIANNPDYAEARSNLGNALRALGRTQDAIEQYERAIAIQPGFAMAHYNLGIVLDEIGDPEAAISRYERALEISPDYAEAHNNLGNALDEVGRRNDAVDHYQRALSIKPDYAEAHRNLSRVKPDQVQVSAIEALLRMPLLSESDATHCHFALGNFHHHREAFDTAFRHFSEANLLKRKAIDYDAQNFRNHVDRLIGVYSEEYFSALSPLGSDSELPLFILGMPRSGTTLIEQIVSSHPDVHGAGELTAFGDFERQIHAQFDSTASYPECIPQHAESIVPHYAEKYLATLRKHSQTAVRITDKMPDNFMRIGLIRSLFPKARIIHCRRNALDTCTSNFLHYFATGNEYSFDLHDLGHYYLQYERLMAHWEGLFSSDMLQVGYEDLVMDQETVSRQMIDYIGLEWHDACLQFHENKRAVNTFSSMQVRQPIYTRAIDRWKHYESQLAPLIAILSGNDERTT